MVAQGHDRLDGLVVGVAGETYGAFGAGWNAAVPVDLKRVSSSWCQHLETPYWAMTSADVGFEDDRGLSRKLVESDSRPVMFLDDVPRKPPVTTRMRPPPRALTGGSGGPIHP